MAVSLLILPRSESSCGPMVYRPAISCSPSTAVRCEQMTIVQSGKRCDQHPQHDNGSKFKARGRWQTPLTFESVPGSQQPLRLSHQTLMDSRAWRSWVRGLGNGTAARSSEYLPISFRFRSSMYLSTAWVYFRSSSLSHVQGNRSGNCCSHTGNSRHVLECLS